MMAYLKIVWLIAMKDLLLEWRKKSFLLSLIMFALLLLLISSMALEVLSFQERGAGYLWVIILSFSSMAGYQLLSKELINGSWRGLLLAPIDVSAIFYGKWLSHLLLLFGIELVVVPSYFLLFNLYISSMSLFLFTLVLGTVGFTIVTTFLSILTLGSSFGAILLPVLQIPILTPLFLAVISMTELAVYGVNGWPLTWTSMLIVYVFVFALLPWILFPLLSEVNA